MGSNSTPKADTRSRAWWAGVTTSVVMHVALLVYLPTLPRQQLFKARSAVELTLITMAPKLQPPLEEMAPPPPPKPVEQAPKPAPVVRPRVAPPPVEPEAVPPPAEDEEPPVEPAPTPVPAEPAPQAVEAAPSAQPGGPVPTPSSGGTLGVPRRAPGAPGGRGTGPAKPNLMLGMGGAARLAVKSGGLPPPPDPTRPKLLESAHFRYRMFYKHVKELIRLHWKPLEVFRRHALEDQIRGVLTGQTAVDITIDRTGKVLDAVINQAGSAPFLDEDALRALQSVGSFTNPPAAFFTAQETFKFRFNFMLTIVPPTQAERLMRSNSNIFEAAKNLLTKEGRQTLWCETAVECGKKCSDVAPGLHIRLAMCPPPPR